MFHDELTLVKLHRRHLRLFEVLQYYNAFLCITLIVLKFQNFRVRNQSFFRLFAFFVQNTQVVPDLVKFRTQSWSLDNGFERLGEIVLLIKQDCQWCPIDSIVGWFHSRLLEAIERFSVLLQNEITPRFYVKVVGIVSCSHVSLTNVFHGFDDVTLLEMAPGNVLVDTMIFLVVR